MLELVFLEDSLIHSNMKKSEIFDTLAAKVCEECEVSYDNLINDRKSQAVVDARAITVFYLRRIGFTNDEIAKVVLKKQSNNPDYNPTTDEIKLKAKSVDKMFKSYYVKHDSHDAWKFNLMDAGIKKFCHERYNELFSSGMKVLPD